MIGIFAIFLIGYWVAYGKRTFEGPVSFIVTFCTHTANTLAQQLDIILGERPELCEATDELAREEKQVESRKE